MTLKPAKRQGGRQLAPGKMPNLVAFMNANGISLRGLARSIDRSKGIVQHAVTNGVVSPAILTDIEAVFREAGLTLPEDLWVNSEGQDQGLSRKRLRSLLTGKLIAPVYAAEIRTTHQNQLLELLPVQPLSNTTLRHFALAKDPFLNEIDSSADIFWSEEHQACLELIERAATKAGLYCIQGEVGSGKTTMKIECMTRLPQTVRVIEPKHPSTQDTTGGNLLEAILLSIAGASANSKGVPTQRERRALRVEEALRAVEAQGMTAVLFIEEGHDRSRELLRELKRFHELRHGFARLLGIVIFAQPEFQKHLNDLTIREFTDRCAIFEMRGLLDKAPHYLAHKLERAGGTLAKVFEESGVRALCQYCTKRNGINQIHGPYPLQINKVAAMAMNRAADLGLKKVTAEVVDRITPRETR